MFAIFTRTADGQAVRLFTWIFSAESGIARAKVEAAQFGYDPDGEFWAEPV